MLRARLLGTPGALSAGIAIDRAPPLLWLGLLAAALLPTWWWMARRLVDRSDDPLGILALGALLALGWWWRDSLRASPRLGWMVLALAGAVVASLGQGALPPLLCALAALLVVGCALAAFLPWWVPSGPVLGLSVLSLPLLASLQFYAGYPLRVVTAEASRWLLAPFFAAERMGAALRVDGKLVIVDAPCSGVQMLWMGEFTACVVALVAWRSDRAFLTRLPLVSAIVLAGNVVRNTVLVAFEAGGAALPHWGHEGVGLVVLALVCGGIAWVMQAESVIPAAVSVIPARSGPAPAKAGAGIHRVRLLRPPNESDGSPPPRGRRSANTFLHRVAVKSAWALLLPACLATGCWRSWHVSAAVPAIVPQEAPMEWNGNPLRPLALSDVEVRFAQRFPGSLARLTDGHDVLVLRTVQRPTRMLHPAADCYQGLGWRVAKQKLQQDEAGELWRCFVVERGGARQRVCERIVDAQGRGFTDASAWYWAAALGQSLGPWQAFTVASPL